MAEMWKPLEPVTYQQWVNKIILELDLNEWEQNFIQGLYKLLAKGHRISELQAKKLEDIYVRTS